MAILYRLGLSVLHLRRQGRLRLGRERLQRQLHLHHELPWTIRPLVLPADLPATDAREVVRRLTHLVAGDDVWRARWLRARRRPVRGAERTYARRHFAMSSVARNADVDRLLTLPTQVRDDALRGLDMRRVKRYWKLSVPPDNTTVVRETAEAIAEWLRGIPGVAPRRWHDALPGLVDPAVRAVLPTPGPDFAEYVRPFSELRPGRILVIEDKDPASGW